MGDIFLFEFSVSLEQKVKMKKIFSKIAVLGPLLFWGSCILSAGLLQDYSHFSQYISELGAQGSQSAILMNYLGILPMGLSMLVLGALRFSRARKITIKISFFLLAISGFLFGLLAFFSCDAGCDFEDMSSQAILHNQIAFLTFLLFPIIQALYLIRPFSSKNGRAIIITAILLLAGIISLSLLIKAGIYSDMKGFYQRLYLLSFHGWLVYAAITSESDEAFQNKNHISDP